MQNNHIIIVGTGLSGLSIAYFLRDSGLAISIVEARDRIGGRILTKRTAHGRRVEMGATWLGKKHTHPNELLRELNIGIFEQVLGSTAMYEPISSSLPQIVTLPPNTDPSYRIKGGSTHLIDSLYERIKGTTEIDLNNQFIQLTLILKGLKLRQIRKHIMDRL